MRSQPNRNYKSEDRVMTPDWLAELIVDALQPSGTILEPCSGQGAFLRALKGRGKVEWCEIEKGRDFLKRTRRADWIVTNPPWSRFADFLIHGLELADNVAMLATVNHWWTKRRVREVLDAGFGYRRLVLVDWPQEFPASGFQLGVMHVEKGYTGAMTIDDRRSRA